MTITVQSVPEFPNEIWAEISSHLEANDECRLAFTCKALYAMFEKLYLHTVEVNTPILDHIFELLKHKQRELRIVVNEKSEILYFGQESTDNTSTKKYYYWYAYSLSTSAHKKIKLPINTIIPRQVGERNWSNEESLTLFQVRPSLNDKKLSFSLIQNETSKRNNLDKVAKVMMVVAKKYQYAQKRLDNRKR